MFVILQKYDFSSKSQLEKSITDNLSDVCDTAKVRFFKQITTEGRDGQVIYMMFVILQKYDFSSKSQLPCADRNLLFDVCDTAKVRFFKQITTSIRRLMLKHVMFVILQKYDFSSKSQRNVLSNWYSIRCL